MGLKKLIKRVLTNKYNKRYEKELDSRRGNYQDWITDLEKSMTESDQTASGQMGFNPASGSDQGDFVVLRNPRGREAVHAREWAESWFVRFPEALILYGDEDVWPEGEERRSPYFKPDWSPDLLEGQFYPGGFVAVRKSWLEACAGELGDARNVQEILYEEGAQDSKGTQDVPGTLEMTEETFGRYRRDCQRFVRRLMELAGGYERGRGRRTILHIPRILFHNESEEAREAWMECGEESAAGASGMVSVIIPSKDNPDLLEKCLKGLMETSADLRYEIIVVDNGSAQENRVRLEALLNTLRQTTRRSKAAGLARLLYHYEPMEFDFSKMCNLGARKASGELLLFLNDDVELVEPGCLGEMARLARRPFTGAVGLKLLYPDTKESRRIQHAGITNLPMGPVHKLQFCPDEEVYAFGRNRGRQNVLAVTAACLMVEKEKFLEAGGFVKELQVAFNDVDLCFGLYELGYENVCLCDSFAWHNESYSRGDDEAPEKLERLLGERRRLYERHPQLLGVDPYYSLYWNREGLDTRIRPLYETQGNYVQRVERPAAEDMGEQPADYRQDPCLMVRVESVMENVDESGVVVTGWSVVLGDNNACYEKELILRTGTACVPEEESAAEKYYRLPLQGQYRPDLIENMPDQVNVGLCGYSTELTHTALPAGRYHVGILAGNRVTGMKLINWSNRVVEI